MANSVRILALGALLAGAAAGAAQEPGGRLNSGPIEAIAARTGYGPVVPVPAEDAAGLDATKPPGWLVVRPFPTVDGRPIVRHETFNSRTLGKPVGYNVFLPPGYDAESSRRYPVVYWLHGMNGNEYTNISQAAAAHKAIAASELEPFIMVFANGLGQSFYLDSPDGRYPAETLVIRDLIPHVDATYRTMATRGGRHVAGMSMGGFGCLRLAFKHPDLFASVVSYAGLFPVSDIAKAPLVVGKMAGGNPESFAAESPAAWLDRNVDRIRGRLAVRIICGSQDRQLPSHRQFSEKLAGLGIDHDYEELMPFAHDIDGLFGRTGVEGLRFALAAGVAARQDFVGIGLRDPLRVVRMVRPSYPEEARKRRVEGLVVLAVSIGEDGSVLQVGVVSGPAELTGPMVETVRQWRFEPPVAAGTPVTVSTEVRITFRLGG